MLVHFGITPYIVFDGDYLPSKSGTEKERAARRKESKRAGLELLKLGKTSQAHLELQKAVDVTPEMARLLIEELKCHNIQYVVAPYEADSQLVYLERKGLIQGILSEDSDLLVFGAKVLMTKLDQYGDCVVIDRNDFTACREVSFVGWTDKEFRCMAILSGCDYLTNIDKMGLKTAYRLLRKHKTIDRLIRAIQFDGKFKVPAGYLDFFTQAENTFLYQWVFCPLSKQLVNFMDPEPGVQIENLPYIGHHVPANIARGVSKGDLNPHTKQPIVIEAGVRTPFKPLVPSSKRQVSAQTLDLKASKPIDTFFKPIRTPLAELDVNLFTPSPSQQRLIQQEPRRWSSSAAPSQPHRTASLPSTAPPQPSRRTISESWTGGASAPRKSKRQRLCDDLSFTTPSDASVRVESGRSKFFASSVDPSPSIRTTQGKTKGRKTDITLWSDDSIEEAMADLPGFDDMQPPPARKKISIFADDSHASSSQPSQSTTVSKSTQFESQETVGAITPATSCGSPATIVADEEEEEAMFSVPLSSEITELKSKFSYQESQVSKVSRPSTISRPRTSPKEGAARTHSAPVSRSVLQPSRLSPRAQKGSGRSFAGKSNVPAKPIEALRATIEPVVEQYDTTSPPQASIPDVEDDSLPELEDSAWSAMESEIVIPRSDPLVAKEPRVSIAQMGGSADLKGSEDYIVPDSEAEESDGSPVRKPFQDLSRFAFATT
jgi:exonuclease-1